MSEHILVLIKILYLLIGSLGLLYFTGLPLLRLLLDDKEYREKAAVLAPAVGLAYLVALSHMLNYAGLGVKRFIWIILLSSFIQCFYLLSKRKDFAVDFKEYILPFSFGLISLAFTLYPLVSAGYLSTYGGNSDPAQYFVTADYLKENPLRHSPFSLDLTDNRPVAGHVNVIVNMFFRLGPIYYIAIVSHILDAPTYLIYSVISGLFLYLCVPGAYFLSRFGLRLDKKTSAVSALLMAVNSIVLWIHFDDFLPHIMGIFLLEFALSLFVIMLSAWNWRIVLVAALLVSSLASTYTEAMYFIVVPASFYFIYLLLSERGAALLRIKTVVMFSALVVAWNPVGFYRAVKSTVIQAKTAAAGAAGNVFEYWTFSDMLGLFTRDPATIIHGNRFSESFWIFSSPYYLPVVYALTAVALLCILVGVVKVEARARAIMLSVFAASALMAAATRMNGYHYGYYKTLATNAYMAIIAVSAGWVWFLKLGLMAKGVLGRAVSLVSYIYLTLFLFIAASSCGLLAFGMSRAGFWQSRDIIALKDIAKTIPVTASIQFFENNDWVMSFLKEHTVYLKHPNCYLGYPSFYKGIDNADYILYAKDSEKKVLSTGLWDPITSFKNPTYRIALRNKGILKAISFEDATGGLLRYRLPLTVKIDKGNVEINGEMFGVGDEMSRATAVFSLVNLSGTKVTVNGMASESLENAIAVRLKKGSPAAFELTPKDGASMVFLKRLIFLKEGVSPDGADKSLTVYGKTSNIGGKAIFESVFRNGNINDFFSGKYPEDLRYSIDIYEKSRGRGHPEGHYGYWFVFPLNTEKPQLIRFELDLVKKECTVFINGKAATEVHDWIGPVSDGEFAANFAIWRGDKPLMVEPLFTFKVEGGRLTGFDGKEILKSY